MDINSLQNAFENTSVEKQFWKKQCRTNSSKLPSHVIIDIGGT